MNTQDLMSIQQYINKKYSLTKQELRLKITSESEREDKEEKAVKKEIIYENIIRKD